MAFGSLLTQIRGYEMSIPNCPKCGTNKHARQQEAKLFLCGRCNMQYDGIDDGDVGYGRQDRHAERKEEFEQRQKARLMGRFKGRHGRANTRH